MRRSLLATGLFYGVTLSAVAFAQTPPAAPDAPKPAAAAANATTAPPAPAATPAPPPPPPPAPEAAPPPPPPPPAAPDAAASPAPAPEKAPAPKKPMMHKSMMSGGASNLTPGDTKSDIAPKLPMPMVGANAGPEQYLMAAKRALKMKRTGEAQEALEMAETRALDRSVPVDQAGSPNMDPMVSSIHAALDSLGKKDWSGTKMAIDKALGGKTPSMEMKGGKPMHHKMMKKTTAPAAAQ